jgi:hypothetical protein
MDLDTRIGDECMTVPEHIFMVLRFAQPPALRAALPPRINGPLRHLT